MRRHTALIYKRYKLQVLDSMIMWILSIIFSMINELLFVHIALVLV